MGPPSGTVTFLFTDIEGSTRLWEHAPDAMRTALEHHDTILREVISRHAGLVFSTGGDGLAAAFARAGDASSAAMEAQAELAAAPWPPDTPIRVRMGLHTGEVVERGGDYFGPPVNQAARLMALGHGGQVLCSSITAALLGTDATAVDLGEHRLRDLSAPQRVFQLGQGRFPPLRSVDAYPGNLPAMLTSFIGRDEELALVAKAIGGSRLVTVTGTGGVGKTRLALQVAADALPSFPDGAWLCELAAASDRDSMLQVVAVGLGFTPRHGVAHDRGIAEFVAGKRMLIVLDNCEHLLDASATLVTTLLAGCPNLGVLATSREALEVGGERVVRVHSLGVPEPGAGLDELASSDAARLFLERAEASDAAVTFDAADAAAIAEICRRLDGIPLAIELAAARVIALAPGEIAAHLDERFRLLTGGRRAAVERHHTLRATVDWSYSLLEETDRRVFERLGVFPGTFDAAAARTVASGDGIEDWDVVDALTSLVAKSMLIADRSTASSTRYQMLETLRHYARERLDATGGSDDCRRRLTSHFAAVAEDLSAGLRAAEGHIWHERLLAELDNFRAAVAWGLDSTNAADAELALRIIAHLAVPTGDWGWTGVGAWAEQAVGRARSDHPRYRGAVLASAAANAFYRGDFAYGRDLAAEAVSNAEAEGCLFPASALSAAAIFGDPDELAPSLAHGLQVLDAVHAEDWEYAYLRVVIASMAAVGGRFDLAEAQAAATLDIGRRLGFSYVVTIALYAQGLARCHSQPDAALASLEEYLGMVRSGTNTTRQVLARSLALAAQLRAVGPNRSGALDDLREAIGTAQSSGDRPAMAFTIARAVFVLHTDDLSAAAVLSGVVGHGVLARHFGVLAWEREWFQHILDEIRTALGDERYEQDVARGAALTFDDAVTTALGAIERASHP